MATITPIVPNSGIDFQGTSRSQYALSDPTNLSVYYSYSIPMSSGNDFAWTADAYIPVATYGDYEYAFVCGRDLSGDGICTALRTRIDKTDGDYTKIWEANVGAHQSGTSYWLRLIIGDIGGTNSLLFGKRAETYSAQDNFYTIDIDNGNTTLYTNPDMQYQADETGIYYLGNGYLYDGSFYVAEWLTGRSLKMNPVTGDRIWMQDDSFSGDNGWPQRMFFDSALASGDGVVVRYLGVDNRTQVKQLNLQTGAKLNSYESITRGRGACYNSSLHHTYCAISQTAGGTNSGIICLDQSLNLTDTLTQTDYVITSCPSLASDGTIYYRAGKNLYAISDDGVGNLSYKHSSPYSLLPEGQSGANYASPVIDANGNIIICSSNNGGTQIHIFQDRGTYFELINAVELPFAGDAYVTPSIGASGLLYVMTLNNNILYALGTSTPPATTTTTTTPMPGESSSSSSDDDSSSSESEEVTTTTTTPVQPLSRVITSVFVNGTELDGADGSDSNQTTNTPKTNSLTFGVVAPKETSKTIVVALKVPYAKAIRNVRIALTNTGGIEFANNIFGVTSSYKLDDITPATYFQGVNEEKLESSIYNITIDTQNDTMSDYVYLNVKMPDSNFIGAGTIRFKWFFDYAD